MNNKHFAEPHHLMVKRLGIFHSLSLDEMRVAENLVNSALNWGHSLHLKGRPGGERMVLGSIATDLVAAGYLEEVPPRFRLSEAGKTALKTPARLRSIL